MSVMILKLSGSLQSWGSDSRFTQRGTRHEPTKSGIIGLLAAALGRSRSESVEDLASLPIAVRIDQPGSFERDFHTAHKRAWNRVTKRYELDEKASMPLSQRIYLADALFMVGIKVEDHQLLADLQQALEHPAFPLYLGRRSCPPSCKILFGVVEDNDFMSALSKIPWQASVRHRRIHAKASDIVRLEVMRDVLNEGELGETVRDIPLSFSQEKRDYAWRIVVHDHVNVSVSDGCNLREHDPWTALEGV